MVTDSERVIDDHPSRHGMSLHAMKVRTSVLNKFWRDDIPDTYGFGGDHTDDMVKVITPERVYWWWTSQCPKSWRADASNASKADKVMDTEESEFVTVRKFEPRCRTIQPKVITITEFFKTVTSEIDCGTNF